VAKSVLNLYLQKVKEGEEAYLHKLCERLAERLVHVPTTNATAISDGDGHGMKVNVMRIKEAHRSLIPVFTSEKLLKAWAESRNDSAESIGLLGADFCAVLGKNSWLLINPGSPEACELQPYVVEMIAKAVQDDTPPVRREVAERILGLREEQIVEEESKVSERNAPEDLEDAVQVESVSGSKLMVREKSSTSIPRPIENEGGEPKKRSFLSFLKFAK
jgi:hypothetical protein